MEEQPTPAPVQVRGLRRHAIWQLTLWQTLWGVGNTVWALVVLGLLHAGGRGHHPGVGLIGVVLAIGLLGSATAWLICLAVGILEVPRVPRG